ncbi:MAG: FAD-dependent thymidylate synthase [archaeon]
MESPLQVILAGMNVDNEGLNEIKKILSEENLAGILTSTKREEALTLISKLTPETIAAAYARISRNPRDVSELRKIAREEVSKARSTNQNLIFTMGHRSIAEHVVFNMDLIGISRRAVEEVEKKRLQSYTEKSQRYIALEGDSVVPPEIRGTPLGKEFVELIEKQNEFYHKNLKTLIAWHIAQNPELASDPDNKNKIEGYGKEDARYALAMATQTQLGMTLSARNLERLITELRSSESEEIRDLGGKLLKEVKGMAPSVVKYTEPTEYYTKTRKELREYVSELIKETKVKPETLKDFQIHDSISSKSINLFTNLKRDDSISAGVIFSSSNLPFNSCLELVHFLKREERIELLKKADAYQEVHDPKLREYELGDRIAEITLSSSAFAQLKRHRMNTLISQEYDISLNPTIPDSIFNTSLQGELIKIVKESSRFYKKLLLKGLPKIVAEYALTNAHKRRVLLDANNRQIYAICAERENLAAQWDIRNLANELHGLIQKESPLTTAYLCGKDQFDEVKAKRYS